MKLKGILYGLFVLLSISELKAQNVYFNFKDDTHQFFAISEVRKLTFSNDTMLLHLWDGTVYFWEISTIGNFQYEAPSNGLTDTKTDFHPFLSCYPNPASNELSLSLELPHTQEILIALVTSDGRKSTTVFNGQKQKGLLQQVIPLNSLENGLYQLLIQGVGFKISKPILVNH